MSHKTSIKVNINSKDYLKKALDRLGFNYTEKENQSLKTNGHYGIHEDVDIRIESCGDIKYNGAVGFKEQEDGSFEAIGDFYGLRDNKKRKLSEELLKQEVTAHCKEQEIIDRLNDMQFTEAPNGRVENDSEIEITYEQWV